MMTKIAAVTMALVLGTGPALAQDAEALRALFDTQLKDAQKTRSLGGKPKHRGLVLVPNTAAGTQEIEFEPVDPGTEVNIRIGFDFDSDALRTDQLGQLDPLCEAMTTLGDARFRIIGHTDASGEGGYNDNLSLRRALSVKTYLNQDCGIGSERLEAVGVGERYLVADAEPDAALQRRVEFQALPN